MNFETRNVRYNHLGGIDCDIDHPEFGWIPTSFAQGSKEFDELESSDAEIAAFDEAERPVVPLMATGRELLAAAKQLAAQDGYPDDLSGQLAAFVVANPEFQLAWTPNQAMRRDAPEMIEGAVGLGEMLQVNGSSFLDALFQAASEQ